MPPTVPMYHAIQTTKSYHLIVSLFGEIHKNRIMHQTKQKKKNWTHNFCFLVMPFSFNTLCRSLDNLVDYNNFLIWKTNFT